MQTAVLIEFVPIFDDPDLVITFIFCYNTSGFNNSSTAMRTLVSRMLYFVGDFFIFKRTELCFGMAFLATATLSCSYARIRDDLLLPNRRFARRKGTV